MLDGLGRSFSIDNKAVFYFPLPFVETHAGTTSGPIGRDSADNQIDSRFNDDRITPLRIERSRE